LLKIALALLDGKDEKKLLFMAKETYGYAALPSLD
jgi:hypothetical protein